MPNTYLIFRIYQALWKYTNFSNLVYIYTSWQHWS